MGLGLGFLVLITSTLSWFGSALWFRFNLFFFLSFGQTKMEFVFLSICCCDSNSLLHSTRSTVASYNFLPVDPQCLCLPPSGHVGSALSPSHTCIPRGFLLAMASDTSWVRPLLQAAGVMWRTVLLADVSKETCQVFRDLRWPTFSASFIICPQLVLAPDT